MILRFYVLNTTNILNHIDTNFKKSFKLPGV